MPRRGLAEPPGFSGAHMDKDSKEALQVTKELVAKFIETRNISPGNFAEVFPAIYQVVLSTIAPVSKKDSQ